MSDTSAGLAEDANPEGRPKWRSRKNKNSLVGSFCFVVESNYAFFFFATFFVAFFATFFAAFFFAAIV